MSYSGKNSRRSTTGAITRLMLDDLVIRCATLGKEKLIPAYQIAFAGNLRLRQTATLKTDALIPNDKKGTWLIKIDKDKRVNSKGSKKTERHMKDFSPEGAKVFQQLVVGRQKSSDVFLFNPADWKYKDLNIFLDSSAIALGWPGELEWSFHSLRHGQVADQVSTEAKVCHRTQMSSSNMKRYGLSNAKRRSGNKN